MKGIDKILVNLDISSHIGKELCQFVSILGGSWDFTCSSPVVIKETQVICHLLNLSGSHSG